MPKLVDRELKRQAILAGAAPIFAAKGYHHTRMADISEQVGISKGLLYEYFPSKEDLFLELCRGLVPWADLTDGGDAPGPQSMVDLIVAIAASYERSRDFFIILTDFWATITRGPAAQRKVFLRQGSAFYAQPRKLLTRLITRGQTLGSFSRAVDAPVLSNVIIATIEGIRMQHAIDARRSHKGEALVALATMVVRELAGPHARADYSALRQREVAPAL